MFWKGFSPRVSYLNITIKNLMKKLRLDISKASQSYIPRHGHQPNYIHTFSSTGFILPSAGQPTLSTKDMHTLLCTWGSQGPCSSHPRLGIMTAGSLCRSLQHTHAMVSLKGELGVWNPSHPPCPTELLTSPPFTPALEHVGSKPTVHKGSPLTILFAPGKEWLRVTFCVTHKSIIF